jgi:hypothetical protein
MVSDDGIKDKDIQIALLISQAEKLVSDLSDTVTVMRQTLTMAQDDIQEQKKNAQ